MVVGGGEGGLKRNMEENQGRKKHSYKRRKLRDGEPF